MNNILIRGLCIIIGYCFGCINFAFVLGKLTKKIDIRDYGSGNAGTTNALRVLGKKLGLITLVGDILKTVFALAVITLIYGYGEKQLLLWGGIGVFLGHNHPFYMQFKGGKGVAVMIGMILFADPLLLVTAGLPALILLWITKYVSLASITYMALLIVESLFMEWGDPNGLEIILLTSVMAATTIIRHHANIKRLLNGTERKLGQKVTIDQKTENK